MAVLKKVHTGTVTFANTDTTKTSQPINATVNMSRSFLMFSVRGDSNGTNDSGRCFFTGWISSNSTLDFQRNETVGVANSFVIEWQVFEFESGVAVQRGSSTGLSSSTSVDIAISGVNTSRSFAILYGRETGNYTDGSFAHLRFTSSTNLRAESFSGALDVIRWEVVEFDYTCTVQQVIVPDTTLTDSVSSATYAISPVDMSKTFLIGSYKNTSAGGTSNDDMWAWYLSDVNEITFTRGASVSASSEAVIFVVSIDDNSFQVQRGAQSFVASVDTQINVSLPSNNPLLEIRDAGVVLSGYPFNYSGTSSSTTTSSEGKIYTAELIDTSTLQITREVNTGDSTVYWQILEWGRDSSTVYLSDLTETSYTTDLGTLGKDVSVDGNTITVGGYTYTKGLGAHANCTIIYNLAGYEAARFKAIGGIDAETGTGGSATWEVWNNDTNTKIAESGTLTGSADNTYEFDVDITGINSLKLINTDAGDGTTDDHTDWADARIIIPAVKTMIHFLGSEIAGNRTKRPADFDDGVTERWNYDDTDSGQLFTDATGDRRFSGGIVGDYFTSGHPFLNDSGFYSNALGYFINPGSGTPSNATLNILWIKDNFNNILDTDRVYCTASSKFTVVINIASATAGTEFYTIIKDGDTWYISEDDLSEGVSGTFTLEDFNNNSSVNKRWAVFTPTATSFGKPVSPSFTAHNFTDVQAIGFINEQSRPEFSHGFEINKYLFEASSISSVSTAVNNAIFFGCNF